MIKFDRRGPVAALVLAMALVTTACGSDGGKKDAAPVNDAGEKVEERKTQGEPASATGTLTAQDQVSDGTTITVAAAEIDGAPGWIAVHSDVNGAPGPVLGTAQLDEGSNHDVKVTLTKPLEASASVWPMIHVDDSKLGSYEFPAVAGADLPVTDGKMPVMKKIAITVS